MLGVNWREPAMAMPVRCSSEATSAREVCACVMRIACGLARLDFLDDRIVGRRPKAHHQAAGLRSDFHRMRTNRIPFRRRG